MTLTEFLEREIAADEAVARRALTFTEEDPWSWASVDYNASSNAEHGQRWDPAHVLAECEAKRRIVALHPLVPGVDVGIPGDGTGCGNCHALDNLHDDAIVEAVGPCDTLYALAQPYADRPGFDPAWKLPETPNSASPAA